MNISISSLIFTSLLASSPTFVGNQYNLMKSSFQKFTPKLFYNQNYLYLRDTTFKQGLDSVIYNNNEIINVNNHITVKKHNDKYSIEQGAYSITVIDCSFKSLNEGSTIFIKGENLSIYITESYFYDCGSSGTGIIELSRSRCLTITHTCAYGCKVQGTRGFLYYDCKDEDFSLCLYNTIAKTVPLDSNHLSTPNIFCKSGSQYFRCNNMTDVCCNSYEFDAPNCFSFSMCTIVDCKRIGLKMTGYDKKDINENCYTVKPKTINNVNFFTNGNESPIFYFSTQCTFTVTIENSVALSKNKIFVEINNVVLYIKDCFLQTVDVAGVNYLKGNHFVDFDIEKYQTVFPHYTFEECRGPENDGKETNAYGCNAGNCIDSECDHTIGFPDGVIPYTTVIHLDLQTATFTPSKDFTLSNHFSESDKFSESLKFLPTNKFDDSLQFTKSDSFSQSDVFTKTSEFSNSNRFSLSYKFTDSFEFSPSLIKNNNLGNQGGDNKGKNKATIGIIAGVASAAVVAIIVVAFYLIKKRRRILTSSVDVMETNLSSFTTKNELQSIMNEDDPFAEEFDMNKH